MPVTESTPARDTPNAPRHAGASLSVATWLALVSLLALLPLLAFSAYSVQRAIAEQQAQALAALQRRASDAAGAIGHQLDSVFAALRALAQADSARRGDMAAFYETAVRVAEADPRIVGISIVDAAGRQPFNTLRPFGTALPQPPPLLMEMQRPILEQGEQVVSPLVTGEVSQRRVVGVGMPLAMGPAGDYALRAVIRLEAIADWLNEQAWPQDWTAAVVDQNHVILARSRDAERFIGEPVTPTLQQGLREGRTLFESSTKDGMAVFTSVARVPGRNWHVVVGRPSAALHAQVRDSMMAILVAGVLCASLAIAGALYVARRLGVQLRDVVDAHLQGRSGLLPSLPIREVAELSDALARAREAEARAMRELQGAREEALAQLKERSTMLDVLAHEVRQPLNNASAALQAASVELSRDGKLTAAEPLRRAEVVLSEVQASIGNTLAVASLLVGGKRIEGVDTDIDALIEVAIADMPPSEAHRVRIERETSTRTASMDPGLMRLALRNLLANALRCSPPGSEVVVRVSDSDEPLALILDVIDRGPGIAADRLPRPSDPSPPRVEKDARGRRRGLGLHIVQRVMALHGGSLEVLSSGPQGTTMRLVITQSTQG